jgi:Fe2+ or Zn2+ uptake regulation protein
MSDNGQAIERALRRSGVRLTQARRAVLDALLQAERHLTAAQVHALGRESCPSLSLASVYRTLALLHSLGHVQPVHADDDCQSFAVAPAGHSHQLICSSCGMTFAFSECDLTALVAEMEVRTGFRIDAHILELRGLCPRCRAR